MRNKKQDIQHDILFLLISSFIVVAAWIGFTLWHIHVTSTVSAHVQGQLQPIDSTFNQQTIQQLKGRENINPLYVQQNVSVSATPTPTEASVTPAPPIPSEVQNASGSAEISPSNEQIERLGQ